MMISLRQWAGGLLRFVQAKRGCRVLGPVGGLVLVAGVALGAADPTAAEVAVAPHRAVYEMTMERARGGGEMTALSGRLVYELLGSGCEGYMVNRRFVSHISGDELATTSDQQLTTFEEADGSVYRFISRSYFDKKLSEETDGVASRQNGQVRVELKSPSQEELELPPDLLFPFQHLRRLIEAAQAGEKIVSAHVYEGSDGGHTVYETNAHIGNRQKPDANIDAAGSEALEAMDSWPVSIAYFDHSEGMAELPKYEFSYDLFANGVSTSVFLDYGDFALRGDLSSIEFVEPTECE